MEKGPKQEKKLLVEPMVARLESEELSWLPKNCMEELPRLQMIGKQRQERFLKLTKAEGIMQKIGLLMIFTILSVGSSAFAEPGSSCKIPSEIECEGCSVECEVYPAEAVGCYKEALKRVIDFETEFKNAGEERAEEKTAYSKQLLLGFDSDIALIKSYIPSMKERHCLDELGDIDAVLKELKSDRSEFIKKM